MGRRRTGGRRTTGRPEQTAFNASPAPGEIEEVREAVTELTGDVATDIGNLATRVLSLENFRTRSEGFAGSGHGHPFSEISNRTHGNDLHFSDFAVVGHGHGWAALPNNGIHDNALHNPNYQPA